MDAKTAVRTLSALAQDTRLAIYRYLVECAPDGTHAGAIAEHIGVPAATLSFHLKELSHAELIAGTQEGRFVRYTANLGAIEALVGFLTVNCCGGDASKCAPVCVPVAQPVAGKARKSTASR